jgi:histone acetyltransferase
MVTQGGRSRDGRGRNSFFEQGFTEIVFCAVSEDEQRKGYGAFIMAQLKIQANKENIQHFLTYADDDAITYFKKQGFTTEIELDRVKWGGYIKDYVGATPMHCQVKPSDDYYGEYIAMPGIIKEQKKQLTARVRELSKSHLTYKGFEEFSTRGAHRIAIDKLQVLLDRGWNPTRYAALTSPDTQKRIHMINSEFVAKFKADTDAWPFRVAVEPSSAPDYYEKVKDPIDISMIEKRLARGNYYITQEMLIADLRRMMTICKDYNGADSDYYAIASRLEKKYLEKWKPIAV